MRLFPSACVRVCRRAAVWRRPIKTEEIDDQGLRVVAAAEAAADSCFLQTTGNEMALFSWRCRRETPQSLKDKSPPRHRGWSFPPFVLQDLLHLQTFSCLLKSALGVDSLNYRKNEERIEICLVKNTELSGGAFNNNARMLGLQWTLVSWGKSTTEAGTVLSTTAFEFQIFCHESVNIEHRLKSKRYFSLMSP